MVQCRVGCCSRSSAAACVDSSGEGSVRALSGDPGELARPGRPVAWPVVCGARANLERKLCSAAVAVCCLSLLSVPVWAGTRNSASPATQTIVNASGLNHPSAVAVDGHGNVFIADTRNNRVVEVPNAGGAQTTVATGPDQTNGVAVDAKGNVFFSSGTQVMEVPVGGGPQVTVAGGLDYPFGVAVDGRGDVFIVLMGKNAVVEVPAGGGAQVTIASGLNHPNGVAVDAGGDLFIADTFNERVVKVPASGGAQTTVGSGLRGPFGVAVDAKGNVFIADGTRVMEVPANGPQTMVYALGPLDLFYGVAVDGNSNAFITDTGNNKVVKIPIASSSTTGLGTNNSP
jgi:sugar lactone lactonase YvrE